MQTQITARHFEATPALRGYAEESLTRLHRFYDGIADANVVLSLANSGIEKSAEISLGVYRQRLYAECSAPTHEAAIDGCVDRLRRQLLRYKAKLRSKDKNYTR